VQEDVAARIVPMLEGAMREWRVGRPDRLATDMGPVIDAEARASIEAHIEAMRAKGRRVFQPPLPDPAVRDGHFLPPTLIEIDSIAELKREVFGPVLHLLRYRREEQPELIAAINATGFGLTLGVHSRIDETIDAIVERAHAGNQYVNRNMIGAVVGVQPFGGDGLSGTGPKAGGPLYLRRLLRQPPALSRTTAVEESSQQVEALAPLQALRDALHAADAADPRVAVCDALALVSPLGTAISLPGPTGERNTYALLPRQSILAIAPDASDRLFQLAHVLAAGARAIWPDDTATRSQWQQLPPAVRERVELTTEPLRADVQVALVQADADAVRGWSRKLAASPGAVVTLHACAPGERTPCAYPLESLVVERSVSVNTAAAGGNASLMTLG
jgi:RHH-type proline utilization regulon transcriptional repressor/proline dehydrogenase/delta 1-pyrroline-5-carboxylate dehydrogenase